MSDSKPHSGAIENVLALARDAHIGSLASRPAQDTIAAAYVDLVEQLEAVLGAVQSTRVIASHNAEYHTGFVHIGRILADIEDTLSNPATRPKPCATCEGHRESSPASSRDIQFVQPDYDPCCHCGGFEAGDHFDRTICMCGLMHYYCNRCGGQSEPCDSNQDKKPE